MAPAKNASGGAKGGKGKAKKDASSDDAAAGDKGKGKSGSGKGLKPATSINVRHILVGGILILIPFRAPLFCFGALYYYCFLYRTHSFILFGISTTSIYYGPS